MPSLALLRVAAGAAAEWCAARYWEPQSAVLATKRGATAAALRELAAAHVPAAPGPRRSNAAAVARDSDGDEDGEEEEEEAVAPADAPRVGPSASALRRRRGAALRQLADLVPPAGAPLLVAPLLDDGLLAPPAQAEPPPPLPPQPQLPTPPPVDDSAWEATLRTLARRWPPLPWLLLAGAVRRLSGGGGGIADDVPMPDALRAAALGAWVSRLAALASAPPGGSPPLSAAQRRGVMRALLATPAASPGAAAAAAAAAAAVAQPQRGAAPAAPINAAAGGVDALAAAEAEVRALKRRRADAESSDAVPQPSNMPLPWTRVADWTPCAIGAPPPWVLTLDGAPELEPSARLPPPMLCSALFPDSNAPRDGTAASPLPLRIGAWAGDGGAEDASDDGDSASGDDDTPDDVADVDADGLQAGVAAWALPGAVFEAPRRSAPRPAIAAQLL